MLISLKTLKKMIKFSKNELLNVNNTRKYFFYFKLSIIKKSVIKWSFPYSMTYMQKKKLTFSSLHVIHPSDPVKN